MKRAIVFVGRDGEIFIPDLRSDEDLSLAIGTQSCVIHATLPKTPTSIIPRIGPVVCRAGVPA